MLLISQCLDTTPSCSLSMLGDKPTIEEKQEFQVGCNFNFSGMESPIVSCASNYSDEFYPRPPTIQPDVAYNTSVVYAKTYVSDRRAKLSTFTCNVTLNNSNLTFYSWTSPIVSTSCKYNGVDIYSTMSFSYCLATFLMQFA